MLWTVVTWAVVKTLGLKIKLLVAPTCIVAAWWNLTITAALCGVGLCAARFSDGETEA
jgi:hypothetical protein